MTFVCEHADTIEADLQHHYHVNIWADIAAGMVSLRRLAVLIRHLPSDSATNVAVHGPAAQWTLTDDLLAFIGNGVWAGVWQRGGGKASRPTPVERPRSTIVEQTMLGNLKDARARARSIEGKGDRHGD